MQTEHEIEIRVRYSETDAMGFLHHSRYIIYFEIGRTELFRAAGAGGIPTKLVLDANGRVLRVVTGPLTRESATELVEELLPTR